MPIQLDGESLTLADVCAVAEGHATVSLARAAAEKMRRSR